MSVKDQHAEYIRLAPRWKRCRDVVCGQDEVHNAGVSYLPRLKSQTDEDYKAYVMRALFYNATWRTVEGFVGMLFRKPPKVETPTGIAPYLDDIDGKGMKFDRFAQSVATEVIEVGRIGVLVDHPLPPVQDAPVTVAQAEALGLRPVMQIYKAESIINWKTRRVGNKTVLSLVVLQEQKETSTDEFKSEWQTIYRVLDLDKDNLYRVREFIVKDEVDQLINSFSPLMDGKRIGEIPFVFFSACGLETNADDPPMIDLVNVNLSHYRTTADYEHGCHFTGLPTPVISGYTIEKDMNGVPVEQFYIGSAKAWVFPLPDAKATYLEFTGTGLNSLKENLMRKEQQMAVLGARMLAEEKKQVETFGVTALKYNGENSILANIADTVSQGIEILLTWFARWSALNVTSEQIKVQINKAFMPVAMDAATLIALLQAWQAGGLSDKEFFENLQRGDVIEDTSKTFEEHQAEVDMNRISPPDPSADNQNDPANKQAA